MKIETIVISICLILRVTLGSAQPAKSQNADIKIEAVYKKDSIIYKPITNLYPNIGQLIRISYGRYPQVTARADNGQIIEEGGGLFILYPDSLGRLTLKVYSDNKNIKLLSSFDYKVTKLPHTEFTFAGKKSGSVSKKELLADSVIHWNYENMLMPFSYKVTAFKITIVQKGKEPILDIPSDGDKIPQQVRSLIKESPSGTKIFLEYIKAKAYKVTLRQNEIIEIPDSGERTVEAMSFTLAEE